MDIISIEIGAIVVLVALYSIFSGLEIAIVGMRRSKVMHLYKKQVRGSSPLYWLKHNPSRMTSSVNLGNTLVNVAASSLAADVAIKILGSQGIGVAIGVMTFVILIFGEILPKTYCNVNPEKASLRFSGFLLAFTYVMYPFVLLFEYITRGFLKLVGGHAYPKPITEDEIKQVLDLGLADKAIEKEEHKLARNALEFDDKPIKDVITQRDKIFSLEKNMTVYDALPLIKENGFSRIPIYDSSPDNITGILHIWDVARLPESKYHNTKVSHIARKPIFVYTVDKISDLLIELKKNDIHMAMVLNDSDDLEGLVTVEDLLEEIVGDIVGEALQK